MASGVSRNAGTDSAGGPLIQGSPDVFTNNDPTVRIGDAVAGHGRGAHRGPQMAEGSKVVFANNKNVSRQGDTATCGHPATGSDNVYAGNDIDPDTPSNRDMNAGDDHDPDVPGSGAVYVASKPSIDKTEIVPMDEKQVDKGPGKRNAALSKDCADIASLTPFPTGDAIDNIVLTPNYTVGKLTRKPSCVFDNALRSPTVGLSVEEIVCNLKLLAVNCLEPIRARYPNAFVTNTYRLPSGNPRSQHPKGQAADIQFTNIPKAQYFVIAQWIKDNISYDQLLLEYKTTGSGLPWIHISFDKNNQRSQVLTLLNNSTYSQGLTQLA
jgi:uncharacterized Zn-binding protein involved in type VI secretion